MSRNTRSKTCPSTKGSTPASNTDTPLLPVNPPSSTPAQKNDGTVTSMPTTMSHGTEHLVVSGAPTTSVEAPVVPPTTVESTDTAGTAFADAATTTPAGSVEANTPGVNGRVTQNTLGTDGMPAQLDTPPAPPLTQPTIVSALGRLNNARAHLDQAGFYLGSPMVTNGVEWIRDGKCERLVERRMPPLEPADGSEPASAEPDCDTLQVPQLAYLSFVGTISSTDFFLTADAGWHGPTQYTPTLDKAKASCTVEAPTEAPFAADFGTVLKSIADICKMSETPSFSKTKVLVGLGETRIKLRHTLFEARTDADEEDDDETVLEGSEVPGLDDIDFQKGNKADIMNLSNWPVSSDAARDALKDMAGKFFVVPIPAYDMHGELIHPSFYRRRLENALVAVRFTLTHWSIKKGGGSGADAYIANIVNIRVLAPPKPSVVTPRKRGKVPTFDPLSPLPLDKKRRLFE